MRKFIFKALRYSGLPFLIRSFIQRKKVTIVLFHNPEVAAADMAFKYLKSKYNIIDLNDYVNALKSQNFSSIPSRPMIITFDDGHIKNYELLPIIKKYNILSLPTYVLYEDNLEVWRKNGIIAYDDLVNNF